MKLADTGEKKTARIWHRLDMFGMFDMFEILQLRKWHKLHKLHKLRKSSCTNTLQEYQESKKQRHPRPEREAALHGDFVSLHLFGQGNTDVHSIPYDPCSLPGRLGATINYQNSSKQFKTPGISTSMNFHECEKMSFNLF